MNRSIAQTPSNKRVFGACLLSFMTIIAPIASVGAATLRATAPPASKATTKSPTANEKLDAALFEPPAPASAAPLVPAITATKTDTFPAHPSGQAQPGDEITYDVSVNNGGTDATNVAFNDTIDPNTTLVPGSLRVSPVAAADSYVAEQSVPLSVGAPGVLTNDFGTPAPTVGGITSPVCADNTAPFTCTTTGGGTVVLEADGSFMYTPLGAFTGADTFTYTSTNLAGGGLAPDDTATVTITVDARPTVTATTPTDGATNQSTDVTLSITFSEAVNVTGEWFQIVCGSSGTRTVGDTLVGGGPTTFTINPTLDFTQAESCTVTVFAAQVADQDSNDPPDNLAADYTFAFTMDAAPAVAPPTTPASGATGVIASTNITIPFTESVNATLSSFTIKCPSSGGALPFALSASPASSFTLNPTSDLPAGSVCEVTVIANQITDQDGNDPPNNMLADYVFSFTIDAAPTVTSTTPTAGATGVPTDTNITLNFSESVNIAASGITVNCGAGNLGFSPVLPQSGVSSIIIDPSLNLPSNTLCTVTAVSTLVTDADSADPPNQLDGDNNGTEGPNFVLTFTTDAAPRVTTTNPVQGATSVAVDTNITLNFSEAVDIAAGGITLNCGGAQTFTPALPVMNVTSFVINPDNNLPVGTLCTVTALAANITDVDTGDPPNQLDGNNDGVEGDNFTLTFTTDFPPTVTLPTTPANNSLSNLKSTNITVNFSENVNVTAAGATINCGSGNLPFGGLPQTNVASIVLDPTSDLPAGSTCTVTLVAANISDADLGDPPNLLDGNSDGTEGDNYVFTFGVAPDAVNDFYNSTGNVGIVIAATGVLGNDIGAGAVVDMVGTSTANVAVPGGGSASAPTTSGGSVTLGSDGSFTFTPLPGQASGTDTFKYRITNAGGSSTDATVTITITNIVWFICDACGGSNQGTLQNPYTSINSFSTNNTGLLNKPSAGQRIYVRSGTYDASNDNLTLLNTQIVSGQGQAATSFFMPEPNSPAAYAALTAGTRPVIAPTSGDAATLGSANTLSHFNVGSNVSGTCAAGSSPTSGTLITGASVGNLSISNMINAGCGRAINFAAGGTLGVVFESVSSMNSTTHGINLGAFAGTLTMNAGSLNNATNTTFLITGDNDANITYAGGITDDLGSLVSIAGSGTPSGTKLFSGAITDGGDGDGGGISLTNNGTATMRFNGGLTLSTGTNPAFTATGGGTVEVCDEAACTTALSGTFVNTLTTTTGTALNVANTNLGVSGLTFQSINVNGATNGIILNTVGTSAGTNGGLTVTGTGTTDGSGGTIQNNVQGALFTSTRDLVLRNMNFTNANSGNGTCNNIDGPTFNDTCQAAINMNTVTTATFDNLFMDGGSGSGINSQVGINGRTVSTLQILNSTVRNFGNAANENNVRLFNLTGNCAITNSDFSFATGDASAGDNLVDIRNNTGTLTLDVKGNPLGTSFNNFTQTQDSTLGSIGLAVTGVSTSLITVNVQSSKFLKIKTAGIATFVRDNATMNVNITGGGVVANGNTFDPTLPALGRAIDLNAEDTADLNFNINENPIIYGTGGPIINIFGINDAQINGHIRNNPDIKNAGTATSVGSAIYFHPEDSADGRVHIHGNSISGIGQDQAILLLNHGGNGLLDAVIDGIVSNNTISLATAQANNSAIYLNSGANAGDLNKVCGYVHDNAVTTGLASHFAFVTFTGSAGSNVYLQNFNTNITTTWTGNANTETGPGSPAIAGGANNPLPAAGNPPFNGTCRAPTNAVAMLSPANDPGPVPTYAQTVAPPDDSALALATDLVLANDDRLPTILQTGRLDQMLTTVGAQQSELTAEAAIAGEHDGANQVALFSQSLAQATGSVALFASSVDSLIVPTVQTEKEKTEGRRQQAEGSGQRSAISNVIAETSVPAKPVSLNQAKSLRSMTANVKTAKTQPLAHRISESPKTAKARPAIQSPAKRSANQTFSHHAKFKARPSSLKSVTPARAATTTAPVLNPVCGSGDIAICLGTLRAGRTVNIQFKVTINTPFLATQVSNQGSVSYTESGTPVLTDDPAVGGLADPTVTPVQTCTPPPANMTNWWTGDDTPRDIAGGKDGTLNGAMGYAAGKVLNGFNFDGIDDFVSVGDVDLPSTFTIDAWVNPTDLAIERAIVNKDDGAQRSYFFHITTTGALRALVHSGGGSFTQYQTAAGVVTAGTFQHVAVSYDGAAPANQKFLFYKDGALVASTVQFGQDNGGTPENVALAARIGRSADGSGLFLGVIDEVEFFSSVLPAVDINSIYSADSGGKCKPSDLKITKTHTDPFVQGSTGNTYTITVHNDGPGTTSEVVNVLDSLPPGLTATGWSGSGWACNPLPPGGQAGPASLTCSRNTPLAAGADFPEITLTVTAGVNTPSVTNEVAVSGGGEMDTSDDTASAFTNLTPSADLQVTSKVDAPDPVTASTNITYAISFINNGPSDAQTVTITDAVPIGTTFVSALVTTGSGWTIPSPPSVGGTGNVVFSKGTVAVGETAVFEVVVNVNANAAEGSIITNNAVAASATGDPNSGNNTGTATTTVNQSDIEITSKADTPDPVEAGSNITYTVNFKNNSAVNPASNVTVTDAVPIGTTLVSATTASLGWSRTDLVPPGGTGNIVFSNGLVAGGATATFTIVVKVDTNVTSGTVIANTATTATTSLDTVSANNSASASTTVQVNADLQITSKADAPDPVIASQNITYAINFVNNGPSDAQTVTITDAVPVGTTFVSAAITAGSGWTIPSPPAVGGTGNVVFSKGTVTVGETATFEVVVRVNNNVVEGSIISNSATAAGATNDPTPGNNTGATTTTVNQSDIEITSKADTPDPVEAGNNITYTVNFKNNSAVNTASNVTVTDAVPAGTTLVSATTASLGWSRTDLVPGGGTGNIVFSNALVAAGATATFTIVVKVNTSVTSGTVVANTATAATTSIDTNSLNNSASASTTVQVNADLQITSKTDAPDPVIASQNITYAISFVNNGPSDGQTVTITDSVPVGTTFVSAAITTGSGWTIPSPPVVGGTGNVVFSKGTVTVGETATFEVVVKVNNNAVEGSIITNNATAAGATNDPTPGNNTGTTTTTVNQSDIEITSKTDTPDPVVAGNNITYTVNFKNNSAVNTAANVTVTDAVPTGTTLVSATTASPGWARTDGVLAGGTGNIVFSKALVAASETAVFTIVVKVGPSATTTVTNTATAATTSINTNSVNDSASATTTVQTNADLEITSKTDTPDPVIAGQNITYTINFQNNGPSDAQTVTVTDAVPGNATFVSAAITTGSGWTIPSPPAVGGTGNVVFSKATVAAGETAAFTMVVKVNANTAAGATISNTATAASATNDPTPGNNSKTATTTVATSADLLVVKIDSPDPVVAGSNLTYTITITNNGSSDAQNLQLSDTLPPGTTLVSFTVPGGWSRTDAIPVGGTGTVTATTATLAAGSSAVFTLVVNVAGNTPHNTVLTNSAAVTTTTSDPNTTNNTGTTTTTVVSQPDMTITKTHTGNFNAGQVGASYNITVTNSGTGPTNGSAVTVTDTVPVGLTPTGPNGVVNGWTCAINGQTLTCTRSDVLAGNTSYPVIVLTVNVANPAPLNVTNTATVAGGGEVNTGNNTASDPTTINCTQDFLLNNVSPLVISRFRENGPGGPTDEFVEIFNPATTAHTVASGTCTGGYGVFASAGNGTTSNTVSLVCQIPNGTVIPAGGYYLCTGTSYTLGNLGRNGGAAGATATGDAPIGCGGTCTGDIPNDAGLALTNVGTGITNTPTGFAAESLPVGALIVYDRVGFGPYGSGAPAPAYPSLAGNFCEGGACLQPVGDASLMGTCTDPSGVAGLFPVIAAPPACYGQSGQYDLLRRQTTFDANLGTLHQDTNNNAGDFIFISPNPGANTGLTITGVAGVTAVLGAAGPYNSSAPPDAPSTKLTRSPADDGQPQMGPRNSERNYVQDPTVADPAHNPLGTFVLRFKYTNNSGVPINGLRFQVDNLTTLCGPQTATSALGTASAQNLAGSPNCGVNGFTSILKVLNSMSEVLVDSSFTAQTINGTVMEDLFVAGPPSILPAPGPLTPMGGGVDTALIVNPSMSLSSLGDSVTGGMGNFSTTLGVSGPSSVLRVKVRFGVVKSGRFLLLLIPMAKTSPAP